MWPPYWPTFYSEQTALVHYEQRLGNPEEWGVGLCFG